MISRLKYFGFLFLICSCNMTFKWEHVKHIEAFEKKGLIVENYDYGVSGRVLKICEKDTTNCLDLSGSSLIYTENQDSLVIYLGYLKGQAQVPNSLLKEGVYWKYETELPNYLKIRDSLRRGEEIIVSSMQYYLIE